MKSVIVLVLAAILAGCASAPRQPAPVRTIGKEINRGGNPIQPINVDCRVASALSKELQEIINQPTYYSDRWASVFNAIEGADTHEQRVKSAKAVLWTVRTRCRGF
jgi:PBP1b-binding outer membrane lipoprotein LpoB